MQAVYSSGGATSYMHIHAVHNLHIACMIACLKPATGTKHMPGGYRPTWFGRAQIPRHCGPRRFRKIRREHAQNEPQLLQCPVTVPVAQ